MKWRKLTAPAESGGTVGSLPGEDTGASRGPLCRSEPGGSGRSVTSDASPQLGPPVAADAHLPAGVLPGPGVLSGPGVLPGPGTPMMLR